MHVTFLAEMYRMYQLWLAFVRLDIQFILVLLILVAFFLHFHWAFPVLIVMTCLSLALGAYVVC